MKKFIRSMSVKLQYALVALRKINMPHIGDLVDYNGEQCTLIQGVAKPRWDLLPMDKVNLDRPKRKIYNHVCESQFVMKPLYKRFGFSFMSTYKFYMDYWYSIDMCKSGRISFIQSY